MFKSILLLWATAVPLMGSPGPATLSLAAVGSAYGFRRGVTYLIGIVTGTAGVLLMIATGITGIVVAEPRIVSLLGLLAAAYIFCLAWKIATAPVGLSKATASGTPTLLPGLLLALTNPKAFAAIGAVYASYNVVEGDLLLDAVAKISALFVVIVSVNTLWLAFGAMFSSVLRHPQMGRIVNVVLAILLVATVGIALLSR